MGTHVVITTTITNDGPEVDVFGPFIDADEADTWVSVVQYSRFPDRTTFRITPLMSPIHVLRALSPR